MITFMAAICALSRLPRISNATRLRATPVAGEARSSAASCIDPRGVPCYGTASFASPPQHSSSEAEPVIASVSRRYAKALLSLGLETGEHEKLAESLESVVRAIAASTEARTLAQNPGYTQAQRQKLVDLLAQRLGLPATLVSFLRLLVDRHRLGELGDIARSYRD